MAPPTILPTAALLLALASPCLAGEPPAISDALQQEAMTCVGEALQICPDVMTSEDHGLACMTGKRAAFSPRCRVIYDKVDHALHRPAAVPRSSAGHDHASAHEAQR